MILLARTREMTGESKTRSSLTLKVPDGARILIVSDDDSDTERLKSILQKAGIVSECAKSITAGCEAAKSGRLQVVVSTPLLSDGSWRRLTDTANHYDLGLDAPCGLPRGCSYQNRFAASLSEGRWSDPRATSSQKAAYCNWSMSLGSGKKGMSNSAMIDQKGRLKIPATLVPELKGSGTEFFITSEGGSSVRIYPMQVWSQVEERREHLCCRTKYFGQAVAMNNQGRVLIPIVLRSSAHMRGGVDLLDYLNYLEVWNHAQFLKNLKSSPITAQDKKMLSKLSCAPRFPRTIRLKYPLWQNHYLQAMAETHPELLKSKISAAEQVVSLRLRQLASTTDDYEEQIAGSRARREAPRRRSMESLLSGLGKEQLRPTL